MEIVVYIFGLGYLIQHLGMILQIIKMNKLKSAESVSLDTLILFFFSTISRLYWTTDTILSMSYFTYFELLTGISVLIYILFLIIFKYNYENSPFELLNNKLIPIFFRWYILLLISAIASYFIFPGNDGQSFDMQMLVSFTIFTEAANLVPQIFFLKAKKDSHDISQIYNLLMVISRFLRLIFWIKLYFDNNSIEFLIFADIVNLLMVGGYVYNSFKLKDGFSLPFENEFQTKNKEY
jgi:hypothetical protein